MANRSTYSEGVEVHQRHLENTETQRTAADKEILSDATTRGVLSGLTVSVAPPANDTRLNIASGSAYAPNGEFMTLAVGQNNVALADYTLGTKNYVLLVYDETYTGPESHETDGTTRQTIASVAPRLTIITEAAYNALSLNNPVLSSNDRNRACILAIVTANGPAVPLTSGSIQPPTFFRAVLQSNQPIVVTGVVILSIDSSTNTGNGTLAFNFGTTSFTWQAPGEGSPGVPTAVTVSGVYTITSSGGKTLVVNVFTSALPTGNTNETLTITNIYGQTISRFSAEDFQHRSLVGSGIPSPKNPHALTLEDLSPGAQGTVEEHQDLMHANGITRDSGASVLSVVINTGAAPDTATVSGFSTGDFAYVNGRRTNTFTTSSTILFTDVVSNDQAMYTVWLGEDGNLFKQRRVQYPVGSLTYTKAQILDVVGFTSGSVNLVWDTSNVLSFAAGPGVIAPVIDSIIRLYGRDRISYADVWVKGAQPAPGVTQIDLIAMFTEPALETNMPIVNINYSGASTGFAGYGFGAANAPNFVYDKREYGTLAELNVRKDSGITNGAAVTRELLGDGVAVRGNVRPGTTDNETSIVTAFNDQFLLGTLVFPNISMDGGVVYLNGYRLDVKSVDFTGMVNGTNLIWLNEDGSVETSVSTWPAVYASKHEKKILRLYTLTIAAGLETARSDLRTYVGQKRDTPMGVVALNKYKQVNLTSDPGNNTDVVTINANVANSQNALQAIGGGTGWGLIGLAGATGTSGVSGTCFEPSGVAATQGVMFGGTGLGYGVRGVSFGLGKAAVFGQGGLFDGTACPVGTGVAGTAGTGSQGNGGHFMAAGTGVGVIGLGIGGTFTTDVTTDGVGVVGIGSSVTGNPGGFFRPAAGTAGNGLIAFGGDTGAFSIIGFGSLVPVNSSGILGVGRGSGTAVYGDMSSGSGVGVRGDSFSGPGGKFSSTTSVGCEVSTGHAKFTGGNPTGTTAFSNTLTPKNIIKAWASFTSNNTVTPTIHDRFNITSIVQAGTGAGAVTITVTFAQAFSNGNYGMWFMDDRNLFSIAFSPARLAGSYAFQFSTKGLLDGPIDGANLNTIRMDILFIGAN